MRQCCRLQTQPLRIDSAIRRESRPKGFIRDLCIALAHRWEPGRLFMILTGYLDESGTHDGSPTTMVAGIMGNARQWAQFQTEMDALKRQYGFAIFHAKEFRAGRGEFSGWPEEKCVGLLRDLYAISANLVEAVTCSLPNSEYESYYRSGDKPRRLQLDTKYALCFRYVLMHFLADTIRRHGHHKKFGATRLYIVAESGHKNAGDAARVFDEVKRELDALGCHLLESVTFAGKKGADPLMIADYLAYGTLKLELAGAHGPDKDAYAGPPFKGTGLTHLQFTAEGLAELKAKLVDGVRTGKGWRATFVGAPPLAAPSEMKE